MSFLIEATATNNQAEYQALLKGIRLLQEIGADAVEIFGDSMLVVNQLIGIYECKDDVIKYMLSLPILNGRIGKWILALSEFDLRYE